MATADKIYLHPGMTQIGSNGIVVKINGEVIPVPAIEPDEHGVFIRAQYVAGKVKSNDWCCSECWSRQYSLF